MSNEFKNIINLYDSKYTKIRMIEEDAVQYIRGVEKKWSFSFVYFFSELRDIYLALKCKKASNLKEFTNFCLSTNLPYSGKPWDIKGRRILENLNALINFSLIDTNYNIIKDAFSGSKIGDELSYNDLLVFKEIYFSYFRFREVFSRFITPQYNEDIDLVLKLDRQTIIEKSKPIFYFSTGDRFVNNFFYELDDNADIFFIEKNYGKLLRFWDVFISWGKQLGVIEKFRIAYPEIAVKNVYVENSESVGYYKYSKRAVGCCYVLSKIDQFDLLDYIKKNYVKNYIYLPQLVLDIALDKRISIEETQNLIIEQYKKHKEYFSFERTSEVFIKKLDIIENDKILFPKHNGAYISHLIVRR